MNAKKEFLCNDSRYRVLLSIVALALLALLAACAANDVNQRTELDEVKPPYYGVFVKEDNQLTELTEQELFETPRIGEVKNIAQIQSTQPVLIIWQQNTQLDYLDFYKLGQNKSQRERIKYNAKPMDDGVYEITPTSPLSDGEYCIIQGDPLGMFLPGWCFRIGAEAGN